MKKEPSKYLLYEASVQSPKWQVDYLPQFHEWLVKTKPLRFREDFCGSGKISCEWVKRSPRNVALGLDLDPAVLKYAREVNQGALKEKERERVSFLRQDVLKPTREKFDWIGAFNFSSFVFHERCDLLRYARSVHQSLGRKGTFFLECAGGPGFQENYEEPKSFKVPGSPGKFQSLWEQHQYDPITQVNDYSIHFKLPNGRWMSDAFTYRWRLWGIRDLREVLAQAGFSRTLVLWETLGKKGQSTGEFSVAEHADPLHTFVAYVIGVKS